MSVKRSWICQWPGADGDTCDEIYVSMRSIFLWDLCMDALVPRTVRLFRYCDQKSTSLHMGQAHKSSVCGCRLFPLCIDRSHAVSIPIVHWSVTCCVHSLLRSLLFIPSSNPPLQQSWLSSLLNLWMILWLTFTTFQL